MRRWPCGGRLQSSHTPVSQLCRGHQSSHGSIAAQVHSITARTGTSGRFQRCRVVLIRAGSRLRLAGPPGLLPGQPAVGEQLEGAGHEGGEDFRILRHAAVAGGGSHGREEGAVPQRPGGQQLQVGGHRIRQRLVVGVAGRNRASSSARGIRSLGGFSAEMHI